MKFTMKKMAAFLGGAVLSASASAYDNMYVFGDSLSDSGNLTEVFQSPVEVKFTNISPFTGQATIATDALAAGLGLTNNPSKWLLGQNVGTNYAVGGAAAIPSDPNNDTSLPIQIGAHLLSTGGVADANGLYVIVIGGNDLNAAAQIRAQGVFTAPGAERQAARKGSKDRVDAAVDVISNQIQTLIATGATAIAVADAPDISKTPLLRANVNDLYQAAVASGNPQNERRALEYPEKVSSLVDRFNRKLRKSVRNIEAATGIDIIEYSLQDFLDRTIEEGEEAGLNTTTPCVESVPALADCSAFVFSDGFHPSSTVHTQAGQEFLEAVLSQ
ncbi:hypothetical protein A3715_08685 [Oleiphilus sp. HI0009]|nr:MULTISPECIES: SGNH/GDSL hydrolase family protein [unclassified Oleiphilus]KZX79436.1 hypothetical protein A3715_08685 [Oleiphilus sp. HI0009]KZY63023.1 hypothetical protein A3738_02215 [Oleiphilus sp. HI0066]KZY69347.1 hypothetical protein A3739_08865 [Oleiphilus sp. HI0067]